MNVVDQNKEQFTAAIEYFKKDISSLRTGRATPALVEDITIEAYGVKQQLKTLGAISVQDAKTLAIEPWDKSIMQNIEVGIRNSDVGIQPINDGKLIRLSLPTLTTDRRKELIRVLQQKIEQAKIAVRKVREDVRKEIAEAEEAGMISEDDKFKQEDLLEKMVKEVNEKIKAIGEEKEKEINTV